MDDDSDGGVSATPTDTDAPAVTETTPLYADAVAVLDDDTASDKRRRSAAARLKRLRGRPATLGAGAFDFQALPVAAMRVHFVNARADPAGDAELLRRLLHPFDARPVDVPELARLLTRPYYLLKVNTALNDGQLGIAFHYLRPVQFSARRGRDEPDPFVEGDADLVLFDEHTRRPVFYALVVGLTRARSYDAASGTLRLMLRPIRVA
jgi:hypothetical protein